MVGRYLTIYLIGREAILKRINPFPSAPCGAVGLCGISSRFQLLSPTPGQVPHVLLTRSPLSYPCVHPKASAEITPFDLHVLGAPPAFVLSQDQTLYKMVSKPDYSEFKSLHSQTQSLASCELLLEFLKCFPHSKRVLQVLLIVQFSRSSASHRFREAAYLLYRIRCCLSTLFCDFFGGLSGDRRVPAPFRGAQDSIIRACGSKVNPLFPIFLIFPSARQKHGPKRPSLYII